MSASGKDSSSDFSSDSESNSDTTLKDKDNKKPNSAHSSRSATPTPAASGISDSFKRKQSGSPDLSQAKKLKLDNFNLVPVTSYIPGAKYVSVLALNNNKFFNIFLNISHIFCTFLVNRELQRTR